MWRETLGTIKGRLGWQDTADWVLTDRTQFSEPVPRGRPLQLVVGLDFGTAFTKLVIGEQRVRYAVPFAPYAPKSNPYLLPSALSVFGEQEECLLGLQPGADRQIEDLKIRLINRDFGVETKTLCAAFLAQVLRCARGWLLQTKRKTYQDRRIVWLLNVGLPTDSYHDRDLVESYRQITQVAWTVSVLPGPVSLRRVKIYVDKGDLNPSVLPAPIRARLLQSAYLRTFPEFAVQLVGYVRSPRRRDYLHALIDIGAGTLDFTTFNVGRNRSGEDLFPIFSRAVEPLGTRFLIRQRLSGANRGTDWLPSAFEDVPKDAVFCKRLTISAERLKALDGPFQRKLDELVRGQLKYTKEQRMPISRNWESGVPTFLCGGGARVLCYKNLLESFVSRLPPYKLDLTALAIPSDLAAPKLPRHSFDRLSVAYGLSYIPDDIGIIFREEEIPDFTAAQARQNPSANSWDPPLTDRDAWT